MTNVVYVLNLCYLFKNMVSDGRSGGEIFLTLQSIATFETYKRVFSIIILVKKVHMDISDPCAGKQAFRQTIALRLFLLE